MSATHLNELRFSRTASVNADEFADEFRTEIIYSIPAATFMSPPDAATQDQMNLVEASGTLDFWADPEEDLYHENDGDAL